MKLAFGMIDTNPESIGKISAHCVWCGFEEKQEIFSFRRLLMLFYIPITIKTNIYMKCPRCGTMKVLSKKEIRKISGFKACAE